MPRESLLRGNRASGDTQEEEDWSRRSLDPTGDEKPGVAHKLISMGTMAALKGRAAMLKRKAIATMLLIEKDTTAHLTPW